MRGEKLVRDVIAIFNSGSSPHARGKGNVYSKNGYIIRIIPACAGKRASSALWMPLNQDHPRMRGEKVFVKS